MDSKVDFLNISIFKQGNFFKLHTSVGAPSWCVNRGAQDEWVGRSLQNRTTNPH